MVAVNKLNPVTMNGPISCVAGELVPVVAATPDGFGGACQCGTVVFHRLFLYFALNKPPVQSEHYMHSNWQTALV